MHVAAVSAPGGTSAYSTPIAYMPPCYVTPTSFTCVIMHASSASLCSLLAGCQLVSRVLVCLLGRLPNVSLLYSGFPLFSGDLTMSSAVQPTSLYATYHPPPHCSQVDPPYVVCPFSLTSIPPYFLQASVFPSPLHLRSWCLPFLAPSVLTPPPSFHPPLGEFAVPSPGLVFPSFGPPVIWIRTPQCRPSIVRLWRPPPWCCPPRCENWTFAEAPFPALSLPSLRCTGHPDSLFLPCRRRLP